MILNKYITTIRALDPKDMELKSWDGPIITACSLTEAIRYANNNGLGYCRINGDILVDVISFDESPTEAVTNEEGQKGIIDI